MEEKQNILKEEKLQRIRKIEDIMANISPWMAVGIVIVLGLLFLYPLTIKQYFGVLITGDENGIVGVSNIGFEDMKRPIINLFSKKNPQGGFNLEMLVINESGNIIINSTLYNLGIGESNFPISGESIDGNMIIDYSLYYNKRIIDHDSVRLEVTSNVK